MRLGHTFALTMAMAAASANAWAQNTFAATEGPITGEAEDPNKSWDCEREAVTRTSPDFLPSASTRSYCMLYTGSRHTKLSPPAFEQCPPASGARRQAHFGPGSERT